MTQHLPAPTSLLECIDHLAERIYTHKPNATLDYLRHELERDYETQFERMGAYSNYCKTIEPITHAIHNHGMSKFISLVQTEGQAAIAVALNAGDGIVVKLTEKSYLHDNGTIIPCQLPPIYREDLDGIVVEIFPWIDRNNMTKSHVETMKETLGQYGLQFKKGDDRPDNIGRMPNQELVVLDGEALEEIPDSSITPERRKAMREEWMEHVKAVFPPLYTDPAYAIGEKPLITNNPDFTERFSPLIQKISASPPPPHSTNFFRALFSGNKEKPPGNYRSQ